MRNHLGALAALVLLGFGCTSSTAYPLEHGGISNASPQGPYYHTIRSASSSDGLTFVDDREEDLVLHASVPAVIQKDDGTVITYFVDASYGLDRFGCITSTDNGDNFAFADCVINGQTSLRAVDFSVVKLEDGRIRLYYYAAGEQIDSTESHDINTAVSDDGITFTDEGVVFSYPGLVDPDIFWSGTEWILHCMSLTDGETVVATSDDGMSFTYAGHLKPSGYGVTKPIALDNGTLRMYGFKQGVQDAFYSFTSTDGRNWQKESGTRFTAADGKDITDPYVLELSNGTFKMLYKQSDKPKEYYDLE